MFKRALPWILLLSGWIALAAYICSMFFCSPSIGAAATTNNAIASPSVLAAPVAKSGVWNYSDGANYSMSHAEFFKFPVGDYEYVKPLTNKFSQSIGNTATYLKENPERQLTVTGFYKESEDNTSILPNMGLARAATVKSYIQTLGVPASQILTKGVPTVGNGEENGIITKGIDFSFDTKDGNDERIATIASRLVGKPLTLYFQTNQNTPTFTATQRKDLADMFYYIENVPSSRLAVSGHTDNVGSRNYNVNLSQERATFVKNYLIEKGSVDGAKLSEQGMGPDKPIMSNDTPEGRSKNRRVEITLQ